VVQGDNRAGTAAFGLNGKAAVPCSYVQDRLAVQIKAIESLTRFIIHKLKSLRAGRYPAVVKPDTVPPETVIQIRGMCWIRYGRTILID